MRLITAMQLRLVAGTSYKPYNLTVYFKAGMCPPLNHQHVM